MKNKFYYLTGTSALILVGIAAYFSTVGFTKLFSGSFWPIIIMISGMELGKLVTISFLYRYWLNVTALFRLYLILAIIVLMMITSAGIYGFLSSAYSNTSSQLEQVDGEIVLLEKQREIIQEKINRIKEVTKDKSNRSSTLTSLRVNQEARIDTLYRKGMVGAVKKVENNIREVGIEIEKINNDIDKLSETTNIHLDSISKINTKILILDNSNIKGEVGPLKYIALLCNSDIDKVVNFFILLLVFVCDPLAMCLVIATNKVMSEKEIITIEKKIELKQTVPMKIIITTSNNYLHIVKIFCHLFNKNWDKNQSVEIVGYDKPDFELPPNFKFISLGKQGDKKEFSNDLKTYFQKQDDYFMWFMEDTFIKSVDFEKLELLKNLSLLDNVGRINLSKECIKQTHFLSSKIGEIDVFENTQVANYRLSTQPSIWSREFLLSYLKPNLSPWDFETQIAMNDGWRILGLDSNVVLHNEGVRRFDINAFNFEGFPEETINEMKQLQII